MELLSGILFSLYRKTPIRGDWVVACLSGQWPRLVGDRLAVYCRPAAFNDSKLVVELLDETWEEAVGSVKQELLKKLGAATAGEVKSISLVSKGKSPPSPFPP